MWEERGEEKEGEVGEVCGLTENGSGDLGGWRGGLGKVCVCELEEGRRVCWDVGRVWGREGGRREGASGESGGSLLVCGLHWFGIRFVLFVT